MSLIEEIRKKRQAEVTKEPLPISLEKRLDYIVKQSGKNMLEIRKEMGCERKGTVDTFGLIPKKDLAIPPFVMIDEEERKGVAFIMRKWNNPYLKYATDWKEVILADQLYRKNQHLPESYLQKWHISTLIDYCDAVAIRDEATKEIERLEGLIGEGYRQKQALSDLARSFGVSGKDIISKIQETLYRHAASMSSAAGIISTEKRRRKYLESCGVSRHEIILAEHRGGIDELAREHGYRDEEYKGDTLVALLNESTADNCSQHRGASITEGANVWVYPACDTDGYEYHYKGTTDQVPAGTRGRVAKMLEFDHPGKVLVRLPHGYGIQQELLDGDYGWFVCFREMGRERTLGERIAERYGLSEEQMCALARGDLDGYMATLPPLPEEKKLREIRGRYQKVGHFIRNIEGG